MSLAGQYLTRQGTGTDETALIGARVKRSAATMTSLVNDLLEYARKQLGGKIPITRQLADMEKICQSALENARASHPDCQFELLVAGPVLGDFDSDRLQQVFSNLLTNAAQYRGKDRGVTISVQGKPDAVIVKVKNYGSVIREDLFEAIFEPLVQLVKDGQQQGGASTSLGLGLFICREITKAHGGTIKVKSSEKSGTVFTVKIPNETSE
jgi:signal transduction histidine kinase